MKISVIGAAPLGRRLALSAARAGHDTLLEDVLPSNLRSAREQIDAAGLPLRFASSIEDAVRDADIAIDSVPDELESKLEIFSLLDRMAPPRTIFLTPTLALSIADLASCTYRRERCFALQLDERAVADPARGTPAVVVHPPVTDPTALATVRQFLESLGFIVSVQPDKTTVP